MQVSALLFLRQNNGPHSQQIIQHCVEFRRSKTV